MGTVYAGRHLHDTHKDAMPWIVMAIIAAIVVGTIVAIMFQDTDRDARYRPVSSTARLDAYAVR